VPGRNILQSHFADHFENRLGLLFVSPSLSNSHLSETHKRRGDGSAHGKLPPSLVVDRRQSLLTEGRTTATTIQKSICRVLEAPLLSKEERRHPPSTLCRAGKAGWIEKEEVLLKYGFVVGTNRTLKRNVFIIISSTFFIVRRCAATRRELNKS
jgi:hypothetical protein